MYARMTLTGRSLHSTLT